MFNNFELPVQKCLHASGLEFKSAPPPKLENGFATHRKMWPYYKSKLELKPNSSEILPVNCKFTCDSIPTSDKIQT